MRKLFLTFLFIFGLSVLCLAAGAAENRAAKAAAQFGLDAKAQEDVLLESDDIKKLVLKYDEAAPAQKPAVKAEIEKLQTAQEDNDIKAQELRIKRQEDKVKELRAALEQRKKNKAQTVKDKTENLITKESVEKIKTESLSKKLKDKVKSKTK